MKIAVIGGGASGLLFSIEAAKEGNSVALFEKNEKTGKKLYITGKGRCNLTNLCDEEEFLKNVVRGSKFMYSAIYTFNAQATYDYFEALGVKLKVERGNRVFPVSDKSADITDALRNELRRRGVDTRLNGEVIGVNKLADGFLVATDSGEEKFDRVVVATGGITYRTTGSTGFGYKIARSFGLEVVEPCGALLPLTVSGGCAELAGLTLKNVTLSAKKNNKVIASEFGELLFSHTGVTGPIVLSVQSRVCRERLSELEFAVDLKPALDAETLDGRIRRDFEKYINKEFQNALGELLPRSLIASVVRRTEIPPEKKVNQITAAERKRLVETLKNYRLEVTSFADDNEGIITAGGVKLSEINPSTMEAKKVKGLYFIGETLDVDCLTGGFNLQTAFATAYLCAHSQNSEEKC